MKKNEAVAGLIKDIENRLQNVQRTPIDKLDEYFQSFLIVSNLGDVNEQGDEYFKVEKPIFGLFTTINRNYNEGQEVQSLRLSSFPNKVADLVKIEELTNLLYDTLKNFTIGQGRFNEGDNAQCIKGNWSGKMWIDYESASIIDLKMENGYLSLTIIGNRLE